MVRVLAPGPELAEAPDVMSASARAWPSRIAPPASVARSIWNAPFESRCEHGSSAILLPLAYYLGVVGVLFAIGYPAWRVVLVGLPAVRQVNVFFFGRKRDPRRCLNDDPNQVAWFVALFCGSLLLTTGLGVAVTGGIRSPLLVTLSAAYFTAVLIVGDRRQTRLLLAATAVAVVAMALLPSPWTGPELAAPLRALLTAASVLGVGALVAPVHAKVQGRREALARARDEMVSEALTRAESLERVGSKVAHELKNPLTAVKALVQLGLRNPAEAAPASGWRSSRRRSAGCRRSCRTTFRSAGRCRR
jgi:two-component system sensor histidine kinase HydH